MNTSLNVAATLAVAVVVAVVAGCGANEGDAQPREGAAPSGYASGAGGYGGGRKGAAPSGYANAAGGRDGGMEGVAPDGGIGTLAAESPLELFKECVKEIQAVMDMDDAAEAQRIIDGVLNGNAWLDRFVATGIKAGEEDWQTESRHLEMQQFVAVRAASQPERFAKILMKYYHSGRSIGMGSDSEDDLRWAALKLIRQGALFERLLDEETSDDPFIAKCRYVASEPADDEENPDTKIVTAEFLKHRMNRRYEIVFRRLPLDADGDVEVWLPVEKRSATP